MSAFAAICRRSALWVIVLVVRAYQLIVRPLLVGTCKFVPSCSDYFLEAVREWGVIRGSLLGVRRIARCLPFGRGGIDPVPRRDRGLTRVK